jgi:SAM-dependent methyltransferase
MMALSMLAGRGRVARLVLAEAQLTAADKAADIGCGPGRAVRVAAASGASVTGVDPSPIALRLARSLTPRSAASRVTWAPGSAERLPLADGSATVVWSISSVHHWADPAAGCAEIRRILAPGGRVLLAERLLGPGAARGVHGHTREQAESLGRTLTAAGFTAVRVQTLTAGRRTRIIVRGVQPAPSAAA